RGTTYSYKMERGQAEGTFEWTEFEPHSRLAWHGPPAKAGPGSMEPSGWWELADADGGTRVKLVMTPKPGGLFRIMAPLMTFGMRRGNAKALERLRSVWTVPGGMDSVSPGPSARQSPSTNADSSPSSTRQLSSWRGWKCLGGPSAPGAIVTSNSIRAPPLSAADSTIRNDVP